MNAPLSPPVYAVSRPEPETQPTYNIPLGCLRAFIVVLVVAHHAVLAYYPWLPAPHQALSGQPRLWGAFPTLDPQRWTGWALFAGFNDIFFMALMFFLSGLFVWNSLQRKGSARFLRERSLRLGVPFVIFAALIAPVAYYPAYLQSTATPTFSGFWREWLALGNWPAGPAWFIWMLLAFGCAAAAVHAFAPDSVKAVNNSATTCLRRPFAFFALLVLPSCLAYVPLALVFTPLAWSAWGPFSFQTSRILLYALYFAAGTIVGAANGGQTFLSPSGPLARRWMLWPSLAAVAFVVVAGLTILALQRPMHSRSLDLGMDIAFATSCAASSFAFLAVFLRFVKARGALAQSLCGCSYGIYLVHYPIVNWLQHGALSVQVSGFVKGVTIAVVGLGLSWGLVHILRQARWMARII